MHIPRVYCQEAARSGQNILLDAAASNHLLRVLRLKTGSGLRVFDGCGLEFLATLIDQQKKKAIIAITEPRPSFLESPLHIHLGQGISRGEKMDYTIQKAVELGVTKITPLYTQYSGVTLSGERIEKRLAHWRSIIISACEQCGRNVLPTIVPPLSLEHWLQACQEPLRFILQPGGNQHLRNITKAADYVALVTGPEGGFSAEELALANQAQFQALNLGPRVLRTETAAPAAIAALQCLWGDMG